MPKITHPFFKQPAHPLLVLLFAQSLHILNIVTNEGLAQTKLLVYI